MDNIQLCRGMFFGVAFFPLRMSRTERLTIWHLFSLQKHGGIYVAYIGAFLIALFLFARTVYYCTLAVSAIDGPM